MAKINGFSLVRKLFISLIKLYQIVLSPLMGQGKCCFYPSCSNYAIEAIKEKGIIKGIFIGFIRIIKCHPWSLGGFDPVDKSKK